MIVPRCSITSKQPAAWEWRRRQSDSRFRYKCANHMLLHRVSIFDVSRVPMACRSGGGAKSGCFNSRQFAELRWQSLVRRPTNNKQQTLRLRSQRPPTAWPSSHRCRSWQVDVVFGGDAAHGERSGKTFRHDEVVGSTCHIHHIKVSSFLVPFLFLASAVHSVVVLSAIFDLWDVRSTHLMYMPRSFAFHFGSYCVEPC